VAAVGGACNVVSLDTVAPAAEPRAPRCANWSSSAGSMEYERPISGDFEAVCGLADEAILAAIRATLERRGRAPNDLNAYLLHASHEMGSFVGGLRPRDGLIGANGLRPFPQTSASIPAGKRRDFCRLRNLALRHRHPDHRTRRVLLLRPRRRTPPGTSPQSGCGRRTALRVALFAVGSALLYLPIILWICIQARPHFEPRHYVALAATSVLHLGYSLSLQADIEARTSHSSIRLPAALVPCCPSSAPFYCWRTTDGPVGPRAGAHRRRILLVSGLTASPIARRQRHLLRPFDWGVYCVLHPE